VTVRPTFDSSSLEGGTPECGVKQHASFLALIGQAFHLLRARFPLYASAAAGAFVLQAVVALVWRVNHGIDLDNSIVLPILTTLVYAFVAADARGKSVPAAAIWERFLERTWAVIVIDFILNQIVTIGIADSQSADPLDLLVGFLVFGLSTLLVFTDAGATSDDDVTVWSVIPRAFVRGVLAAWNRQIFPRALAIFSIWLLVNEIQLGALSALQNAHMPLSQALFWTLIPLGTLVTPPLAALTVLVYLDATTAPTKVAE
jgi:hypothetical protein